MKYLVDFTKSTESKYIQSKEKKNKTIADIRTLGDKTLYGAGAGLASVSLLPFRSKKVDAFLRHKRMDKIPIYGRPIREMALENFNKNKLGTRIAMNTPAYVTAGLLGAGLGAGYGAYKVIQNRRKNRYD